MPESDSLLSVAGQVKQMIGIEPSNISRLAGGGNNAVFKLEFDEHKPLVIKYYANDFSRLTNEYQALEWLEKYVPGYTPGVISRSEKFCCAIYGWFDGQVVESANESLLDAMCLFIKQLQGLSRGTDTEHISEASDAVFSAADLEKQLSRRLQKLKDIKGEEADLDYFLQQDFLPLMETTMSQSKNCLQRQGLAFDEKLPRDLRVLSPSDFALHNVLVNDSGQLHFIDFEYFGWDDPVKLCSDMLWHPALDLSPELQDYLREKLFGVFSGDKTFRLRFNCLFHLFGMIWVLILLNEFLPEKWARRQKAGQLDQAQWQHKKQVQLKKAKVLLHKIKSLQQLV